MTSLPVILIFLKKDSQDLGTMNRIIQTSEVRTKTKEAMIHKKNNAVNDTTHMQCIRS